MSEAEFEERCFWFNLACEAHKRFIEAHERKDYEALKIARYQHAMLVKRHHLACKPKQAS